MKLFHVSLDLNIKEEFVPRVPSKNVLIENEDDTTQRICLGTTIKGCLTAVPWGGNTFEDLFFDNCVSQFIRVYEFDSEDIKDNNIVSSEELYRSDKVRDAEISGEVWVVNQNLKPTKTYIIQVTDYMEGSADDVSYEDLQNFDEDEDDYEDILNGCFTTVEYIKYDIVEDINYNTKFLFNFTSRALNEDSIYEAVDKFLSEYWDYYDICINETKEKGIYSIEVVVDLSDKPTTEENFRSLFCNNIDNII